MSADNTGKPTESKDDAASPMQNNGGGDSEAAGSSSRPRNLSESSNHSSKRQRTLSESLFPNLTSASPPKFVSLEEILSAAKGMANMALAHEIAVNSNFELLKREPPENSLHQQVKQTMLKAFWDLLSQQLKEDPPEYSQALVLLGEIKETLLGLLLPHNTKFREEINEVLDTELINQQVNNGTLDFPYYANYVTSMMAKMCTPQRDDAIKQLKQESDIVSVFKGILETLELMRIDMANFTIEMYRPLLIASSVDYEKSKFKEYLNVNPEGLEATKQWLLRRVTSLTPLASMDQKREIINQSYLDLIDWTDTHTFPETLMMDESRLVELRGEVLRATMAATVLLLVVSSVPSLQSNSAFKLTLKDHVLLLLQDVTCDKELEAVLPNCAVQARKDCEAALPSGELSQEQKVALDTQIGKVAEPEHRIRQLVFHRIKEFLQSVLTSTVSTQLAVPAGLSAFARELSTLAGRYHRLVSHNRNVFGEYYTDILDSYHKSLAV